MLLKLQLLAARIGSDLLEEWVKHETTGYPTEVEVPDYRKVGVEYRGTFTDGVRTLNDVQIPQSIVRNIAGESWVYHSIRQPLAEIEHLIHRVKEDSGGQLGLGGAADLIPLFNHKVYSGMSCLGVTGMIPHNLMVTIRASVQSRIMDLTIQFEAVVGDSNDTPEVSDRSATFNQITNSVIHGNVNMATSAFGAVTQTVQARDVGSLAAALSEIGLRKKDAQELADIVSCEAPEEGETLGKKASAWITQTFGDASRQTMVNLLSEVISKFYG